MSNDAFISDDYEAPSSGGGYTKIEQGENRLRILSSPLLVWVIWADGKPTRILYDKDNKPEMPTGENASVKHAWIMTVYNYQTEQIEVMELDKMTIITPLLNHVRDKDWGHPKNYDIVITKSGSGREGTKYAFVAKPHSAAAEEVKEAYFATPIDLNELLKPDGNPFLSKPAEAPSAPAQAAPTQQQAPPPQQAPPAETPPANNKPPF